MFKITHSAGHALTTSGKQSPDGYKEWSYTNEIVKLVMDELNQYENVSQKRIDDPTGKTDYPLVVRTNMVNSFNPQLHIDYHMNAYGSGWTCPGGTETYVYKATLKEANAIASKVQANLVKELGFANRGVKEGDLHMIRETNPTAILIEFAFMSNQNEAMKMRTAEYQKKAALAVVDGIVAQYGLKRKAVAVSIPVSSPPQPSIVYEAHVEAIGWQGKRRNGETAGTTGQSLRLEALTVKLENTAARLEMEGHIENLGWTSIRTNGEVLGTVGESLRLEAIKIKANGLTVMYRVHLQDSGWTEWKQNGETAGTTGQSKRIEAIEIKLV